MAQNETWLKHDLLEAVKVQYLDGNLFSMDNAGNLIGVTLTRDGEDYSGGGSVSANVIRSDGGTVAVSGALSGKTATVVLPQAAYAVPGVVSIIVKLTASGHVTTIAALVANVYRSSTDTAVDPGTIIPSIQILISQINTAVASIPADYSALWTKLAPAFSTDASYVAGQYVTYNSGLYRFNTSHSGSWSSSDVTAVNLGGEITDLKSALSVGNFPVNIFYDVGSNDHKTVSLESDIIYKQVIKVTNQSSDSGFAGVQYYVNNTYITTYQSEISGGDSAIIEIPMPINFTDERHIITTNTNARNIKFELMYVVSYPIDKNTDAITKINGKIDYDLMRKVSYSIIKNEYVNDDTGAFAPYSGWDRTDYIPLNRYSSISVKSSAASGYNGFYKADKSFLSKFRVTTATSNITIPKDAVYAVFSNTAQGMSDLEVSYEYRINSSAPYNDNVYTLRNFTENLYTNTLIAKDHSNSAISWTGSIESQFRSTIPFETGDYAFIRMTLTCSVDSKINLAIFQDDAHQMNKLFFVKANKEYRVAFRSLDIVSDGTLNFLLRAYQAGNVYLKDVCVTINNYNCYYNDTSYKTLKDYNSDYIIVDENMDGHFFSIDMACDFAKKAFDVSKVPVTIFVHDGVYSDPMRTTFPYACIDKGYNCISIIGNSRDGVIIENTCDATLDNKILDIGGNCTIANLTLKQYNDSESPFNPSVQNISAPYCIHNDRGDLSENYYNTVVKNCKLYNECYHPVGAGLQDKQRQVYENVVCETSDSNPQAALYVHAYAVSTHANASLEIDGCTCVANGGGMAITLPNVSGSITYDQIPVSIRRTIGTTTGSTITDVSSSRVDLQPDSALNNVESWNYSN